MSPDQDARELLEEIARVADQVADPGVAGRARAAASAATSGSARVFVVGEENRGKSSLINALLGRPGLLPVDSSVATSVRITVGLAETEAVTVLDDEHPEGRPISFAQLGEYAALDPATMGMRHPQVRSVSVGLASDLLRSGLELVDTPGVGGLDSGHTELTLATLTTTDTVVFVVTGNSELTRSECAFLNQAAERVCSISFVITQTDKYHAWRTVLAADQAVTARETPRLAGAPWFPVSSLLLEDSLELAAGGDAPGASRAVQRSGFGPLIEALTRDVPARAARVRGTAAAVEAHELIRILLPQAELQRRSLDRGPELPATLRASRAQLERVLAQRAWQPRITAEIGRLERRLRNAYESGIIKVEQRADHLAATASSRELPSTADRTKDGTVAHSLHSDLNALWKTLVQEARQEVAAAATRVAAAVDLELESDSTSALDPDLPSPEELAGAADLRLRDRRSREGFSATVARNFPALSGFSMTALAAHVVLGLAVPPLALVTIGAGVAGVLLQGNWDRFAAAQTRTELHLQVHYALRESRLIMMPLLDERLQAAAAAIHAEITGLLTARLGQIDDALAAASDSQVLPDGLLAARQAAADERLARLGALDERAAGLLARLRALDQRAAMVAVPATVLE